MKTRSAETRKTAGGWPSAPAASALRRDTARSTAFADFTDLALTPETGRTHQIRVHLTAHGHPIAGDDLYGNVARWESLKDPAARRALARLTRPLLHAERIEIPEINLDVSAPLPDDYVRTLEALSFGRSER